MTDFASVEIDFSLKQGLSVQILNGLWNGLKSSQDVAFLSHLQGLAQVSVDEFQILAEEIHVCEQSDKQ